MTKAPSKGFTLIEIAVSLIIIGILLGGIAIPISDSFKNSQSRQNESRMNAARDAIIGFVVQKQRFPCPTDVWSGTEEGLEPAFCRNNTNNTTPVRNTTGVMTGIIPWNALGIPRDDAFGNPIYYTVERRLTFHESTSTALNDDSFRDIYSNNQSLGAINILGYDEANSNTQVTLANNVAVVISSLGRINSNVLPNDSNTTYINSIGSSADSSERKNASSCCSTLPYLNDGNDRTFVIRNYSDSATTKDSTNKVIGAYDDQIVWIPWYQIVGIMTQAGRLQ